MRRRRVLRFLLHLSLLGTGWDDFDLPGDSSQDMLYVVSCSNGHRYPSLDWPSDDTCEMCGAAITKVDEIG